MKSTLVIKHLKVENANAISALTYGFPSISHFLGFTHALSRKLEQALGLRLGGCAVIAHHTQLQSYPLGSRGEQVFALTRNPLTKEGKTASFNEEGRVHLDISLLIECEFNLDDLPENDDGGQLCNWIATAIPLLRLAGGTIIDFESLDWRESWNDRALRKLRMGLLPGFALVCRHDLLQAHHQSRQQLQPDAELLDSLLDFVTVRYQAQCEELPLQAPQQQDASDVQSVPLEQHNTTEISWQMLPKPAPGYLVPLTVGYQAISPLYEPGTVPSSRDSSSPFAFVESVYSLGQWVSPHRVIDLESLLWRYQTRDNLYLCHNQYALPSQPDEDDDEDELLDY